MRLFAAVSALVAALSRADVALAQCYESCDLGKYCCSTDDSAYCCSYLSYVGNVLTGAAIAGIVLGLVFLLGIVAAVAVCICSCLKSSQRRVGMASASPLRSTALSTVTVPANESYGFPPPPPYSPYSPATGADLPPPYAARNTGPGYPPPPYPGK